MPEFQASSSADVMEDLGLKEGLTGKPNFSGISETPVEFSTVAQGTKMKVTEAGISAAAVTYATANVSAPDGLIKTDHELIADRPFLFVLVHVPTQTTLFITHVNAPSRPE